MSTVETFRAALVAGDERAVATAEVIEAAGLRVARAHSPNSWEPEEIGQFATIGSGLRRFGRPVVLSCLTVLLEAFPDERMDQAGRILGGLFRLYADPPQPWDADRVFRALLTRDQAGWAAAAMTRIAETGDAWPVSMEAVLREAYAAAPAATAEAA